MKRVDVEVHWSGGFVNPASSVSVGGSAGALAASVPLTVAVPEPSAFMLLGLIGGLGGVRTFDRRWKGRKTAA